MSLSLVERGGAPSPAAALSPEGSQTRSALHSAGDPAQPADRDLLGPADRLALDLRKAIWTDQLVVHYQPQIELPGGSLVGVEALVRWNHPRLGLLGPAEFLPLAERAGLMPELTISVLSTAASQVSAWWRDGYALTMSVNLAPGAISPDLVRDVERIIDICGLPAGTFCLELTEDLSTGDAHRILRAIERLRQAGVRTAADDFGTGCSSFSLLQILPIDEIKVDRSFIRQMQYDCRSRAIVQSMIDLSGALGIKCVAEGIEDQATLDLLRAMGCTVAQGYLLGRPVTPEEIRGLWLRQPA